MERGPGAVTHGAEQLMAAPILVVDDDIKIVQLVRTYLERDGFCVVEANDGLGALHQIEAHAPQLVVLDLMLPELDGIGVMRRLRQGSNIPVLMLSARGSTADRVIGIGEGADDYLAKPFSPAELVVRVRSILRRAGAVAPGRTQERVLELDDLAINLDRHQVTRDGKPIPLTASEFRLLTVLVEAEGRVLTRDMLIEALYRARNDEIFDRTVDVQVRRLRDRLGDDVDTPRYIATVRGAGYRAAITRPTS